MNRSKKHKNIIVPPADIILAYLNDDPGSDEAMLNFYKGYIYTTAIETCYSENDGCDSEYLNEDLMQEITAAFLKSLPVLRNKIIDECLHEKTLVVVVTTDNLK